MKTYMMKTCLLCLAVLSGGGIAHADGRMASTYAVPVTPELAAYATFATQVTVSTGDDGLRTLQYDLPPELVGPAPLTIRMTEVAGGAGAFDGEVGHAACDAHGGTGLLCLVTYKKSLGDELVGRQGAIDGFLGTTAGAGELAKRRAVATAFSTEPAGVLNVGAER